MTKTCSQYPAEAAELQERKIANAGLGRP